MLVTWWIGAFCNVANEGGVSNTCHTIEIFYEN